MMDVHQSSAAVSAVLLLTRARSWDIDKQSWRKYTPDLFHPALTRHGHAHTVTLSVSNSIKPGELNSVSAQSGGRRSEVQLLLLIVHNYYTLQYIY